MTIYQWAVIGAVAGAFVEFADGKVMAAIPANLRAGVGCAIVGIELAALTYVWNLGG